MKGKTKVKFLIFLLLLLVVALLAISVFQLVKINKTNQILNKQNDKIERLEKELDYHKNKNLEENYEDIIEGETNDNNNNR